MSCIALAMVNRLCYVAHRTCVGQGSYPTDGRYTLLKLLWYIFIPSNRWIVSIVSNPADGSLPSGSKIPIDLLKSGSNLKKFERFVSFKRISNIG